MLPEAKLLRLRQKSGVLAQLVRCWHSCANTWALKGVGARQHLQHLGVGADCANSAPTLKPKPCTHAVELLLSAQMGSSIVG